MRWNDVLTFLAVGITLHDLASIYNLHIPGFHAVYFSIPLVVILLGLRMKSWLRRKNES